MDSNRKTPAPLVHLEGVSVIREKPILRDIDWTIRPGEHWVLLGANGSGKTSLLNLLTGYLTESGGRVHVLNDDDDIQTLRKKVGIVSANVAQRINEDETAFEVVLSGRGGDDQPLGNNLPGRPEAGER